MVKFWKSNSRKSETDARPLTLAAVIDKNLSSFIRFHNIKASFFILMLSFPLIVFLTNLAGGNSSRDIGEHIAMINLTGAISGDNPMGSARDFSMHFRKAIEEDSSKAILIIAGSGGGSPVQAEMMNEVIANYTALPLEERKPVYVSVQEVCASACMLAVSAADRIFAHNSSVVGSISVRMDGWGIERALDRVDIQRKVLTTGKYKDLFDSYKTLSPEEEAIIQTHIMQPLHENFVSAMKESRPQLDLTNDLLFTGMIWSGRDAIQVGLVDEIKTTQSIEDFLKETYEVDTIHPYNRAPRFGLMRLLTSAVLDEISQRMHAGGSISF